jgi:hypothetical protein
MFLGGSCFSVLIKGSSHVFGWFVLLSSVVFVVHGGLLWKVSMPIRVILIKYLQIYSKQEIFPK